ncbi:N,N-dimethylformamidase beta subunit family domain-containing protein [Catenulispora subtropica]|uniref:N,N-dimethylformamidase beta subunit-like C-terminal domain-containing protein n=1 Tax=Catenulispora subtropica TaxID=450798 RepID=A0ABN2RPL8_9ACTN
MKTRRPALPPLSLPLPLPLSGTRRRAGAVRAVQAYASSPSAPAGGTMEFRVSVPSRAACSVAVRRIGTPVPTPAVRFAGEDQDGASVAWVRVGSGAAAPPLADGVGVPLTWCDWEPSLLLDIPESWPPGLYVARFSVEAPLLSAVALRGRSAYVPFVVRAPLAAGFPTLVILPFAEYAAANPWPTPEVRRARAVSLDRPFAGNGLPQAFAADAAYVEAMVDTDFATSLDLHAGFVDPGAYRRILFRSDVWSPEMRAAVTKASLGGTDVGGLDGVPPTSVDFVPGPDGRRDRVLIRY